MIEYLKSNNSQVSSSSEAMACWIGLAVVWPRYMLCLAGYR